VTSEPAPDPPKKQADSSDEAVPPLAPEWEGADEKKPRPAAAAADAGTDDDVPGLAAPTVPEPPPPPLPPTPKPSPDVPELAPSQPMDLPAPEPMPAAPPAATTADDGDGEAEATEDRPGGGRLRGALANLLFGPRRLHTHLRPRWLCLRLLGAAFLGVFASLHQQLPGLIGPQGVLPALDQLDAIGGAAPTWQHWLQHPTLLWLDAGPLGLQLLTGGGMCCAVLLLLNIMPRLAAVGAWLCFLAFFVVGGPFTGGTDDRLLLELGLLAMFLAPPGVRPGLGAGAPPSRLAVLMTRWLCLRLLVEAAVEKIHDGSWMSLLALTDLWERCDMPTWLGVAVGDLPTPVLMAVAAAIISAEAVGGVLVACGRGGRFFAFLAVIGVHVFHMLTVNVGGTALVAIAAAMLLLDDDLLAFLATACGVRGDAEPDDHDTPEVGLWRLLEVLVLPALLALTLLLSPLPALIPGVTPPALATTLVPWLPPAPLTTFDAVAPDRAPRIVLLTAVDGPDQRTPIHLQGVAAQPTEPPPLWLLHMPRLPRALRAAAAGDDWSSAAVVRGTAEGLAAGSPALAALCRPGADDTTPAAVAVSVCGRQWPTRLERMRDGWWWRPAAAAAPTYFQDPMSVPPRVVDPPTEPPAPVDQASPAPVAEGPAVPAVDDAPAPVDDAPAPVDDAPPVQ
jgi:hypothetical protein